MYLHICVHHHQSISIYLCVWMLCVWYIKNVSTIVFVIFANLPYLIVMIIVIAVVAVNARCQEANHKISTQFFLEIYPMNFLHIFFILNFLPFLSPHADLIFCTQQCPAASSKYRLLFYFYLPKFASLIFSYFSIFFFFWCCLPKRRCSDFYFLAINFYAYPLHNSLKRQLIA